MGKEVCFLFTFAFDTELIAVPLGSGQLMEPRGLSGVFGRYQGFDLFFPARCHPAFGLVVHVYMVCVTIAWRSESGWFGL